MDITKIPAIMRSKGWIVGASLLDEWFRRSVAIAPGYSKPEMLVNMSWVKGFSRAKDVVDQAIADKIWVNAAAKQEIASRLKARGFTASTTATFGDLSKLASEVDKEDQMVKLLPTANRLVQGRFG